MDNDFMTKILHIEDNPANKILIERVLEAQGYTIVYAPDGESGIVAALEHKPDLILLDMGLPDIDGQTVATLIRQMPELKDTPVVVITAWPAEKALETTERYRLTGCILKPIDVKSFPQQIAGFLAAGRQPGALS
jgi:CheY-like chemotaxis protein